MPLYEYRAQEDGQVIELMRSMNQADDPVPDPSGKDRTFHRIHSTFSVSSASSGAAARAKPVEAGGCCPCGDPAGPCNLP